MLTFPTGQWVQEISYSLPDKILKVFTCFYGILGPFLCTKLSVRKFGCATELSLRWSDLKTSMYLTSNITN